ncbi:hypothetical protein BCR33DRAFT_723455 [Rhizoclosmatium globosum]|uniref:EKC/KEOPS complex subunit GON7 n=1 Tax=Rhizoclosmatium globosum TaxID=329046 RepID=A0A1Y2BC56_9FUNG|nr:hypothetical protein BCR33DRAFT_723455 [Rhizoclosmatium globosum]|eukprot:ORY32422.1 hypothetical protein BCR33DRAFT_723455 [Rhizoclosmatium globosum]
MSNQPGDDNHAKVMGSTTSPLTAVIDIPGRGPISFSVDPLPNEPLSESIGRLYKSINAELTSVLTGGAAVPVVDAELEEPDSD